MTARGEEVTGQLYLIADELDSAANAMMSRVAGRSRELRAWAVRLRKIARLFEDEFGLPDEERASEVVEVLGHTGLGFARKAAVVLALASSAVADAPAAIEHSVEVVNEAVNRIEAMLEDENTIERTQLGQEEAQRHFADWLRSANEAPSQHGGEVREGVGFVARFEYRIEDWPVEIRAFRIQVSRSGRPKPELGDYSESYIAIAAGEVAQRLRDGGSGHYLLRVRLLDVEAEPEYNGTDVVFTVDDAVRLPARRD